MVKVIWTARSVTDINQIAEYISKDSFHYAAGVVERILECEEYLKNNPSLGGLCQNSIVKTYEK